jgi:hypothetical protein
VLRRRATLNLARSFKAGIEEESQDTSRQRRLSERLNRRRRDECLTMIVALALLRQRVRNRTSRMSDNSVAGFQY